MEFNKEQQFKDEQNILTEEEVKVLNFIKEKVKKVKDFMEFNSLFKTLKPLLKKYVGDFNELNKFLDYIPDIVVIVMRDKHGLKILKESGLYDEINKNIK